MNIFKINQEEINVLGNFATINQMMIIKPDQFGVKSNSNSVVAVYKLKSEYELEQQIGIIDVSNFLSVLSVYKDPTITYHIDKNRMTIKEGRCINNYGAHALELIESVPNVELKCEGLDWQLAFTFSQEKLVMLRKMSILQKSTYVFFETVEDTIRITVGNELGASDNIWEVTLSKDNDGIKENSLPAAVKINVVDLKLMASEYQVSISNKGISRWIATDGGPTYYIALDMSKN